MRVRADEVGLLGVEVGRLDELGREEVLKVAQQAPVLHEPFNQSITQCYRLANPILIPKKGILFVQ